MMSSPIFILLVNSLLVCVLVSQGESQFLRHDEQCGTYDPFPHEFYDLRYLSVSKVRDGLGLQVKILNNPVIDNVKNFPYITGLDVSSDELSKLLKIIQQRNAINALSPAKRAEFGTVMILLDTLANDTCSVIQRHLSGRFLSFTCSEQDIADLQSRLQYKDMMGRLRGDIIQLPHHYSPSHAKRCMYWNNRIMRGCSSFYTPTNQEVLVHTQVVTPAFSFSCNCRTAPLCVYRRPWAPGTFGGIFDGTWDTNELDF